MLATLVGLSMLLAVGGGIATLAGVLLGRRLRAWLGVDLDGSRRIEPAHLG